MSSHPPPKETQTNSFFCSQRKKTGQYVCIWHSGEMSINTIIKSHIKLIALWWEVVNTCISLHDAFFFLYDSKDFLLVQFFCHRSPFLLPYSLSSKLYMLFSLGLAFILASYTCFYLSNIKLNLTYLSCQISFIISEIIPLYEWLPGVNMRNG